MDRKLGIIAGEGNLPAIIINNAKKCFDEVVVFYITPRRKKSKIKKYFVQPGKIGLLLKLLKQENIKNIVFAGKIRKETIFKKLKFDLTALRLLMTLRQKTDTEIMLKIIDYFKHHGINTLPQTIFLKDCITPKGILGKYKPDKKELADIEYGSRVAKIMATLDIGQSIIVKDKTVLAVEGIEGTDETIKRIKKLGIKDTVLIKSSRKNQDLRFDIPAAGLQTLKIMKKSDCRTLAIEAGKTFLINKEKMIQFADRNRLCIVGY